MLIWTTPSGRFALGDSLASGLNMQDMKASAQKLRVEADLADHIACSATDDKKRELYERLAAHFRRLAEEIEKAMRDRQA